MRLIGRKTLAPLVVFLAVGLAGSWASAQESDLPRCKGSYDQSKWNNCFGTYTWPSSSKYVGEWRNGKFHGQGTYTFDDGDKYIGEWRDDKRNGQGTYTYADGDKYVGEWRDGEFHGQGTYTWSDGEIETAIWENGELVYIGTRRQKAHEDALDRCLYAEIDKITSDAAEKIVKKKCQQELRDLSISELREAYD